MRTLKEAVTKAIGFTTKAVENHHVVILKKGSICASSGMSGCVVDTDATEAWKPEASVAVDGVSLRKILTSMSPDTVTCKRNVLHLKDASGEVRLGGITKAAAPNLPSKDNASTTWELSPTKTAAAKALAEVADKLNARDNLQGVHITSSWMAVLSSRLVCVLWSGLPGLDGVVSVPSDMWRKLIEGEATVMLDGSRFWVCQEGSDYWSLAYSTGPNATSVDLLVERARSQRRLVGTVKVDDLIEQARLAAACGKSPAEIFKACVGADVEPGSVGFLTLSGDAGQTRLESGIAWETTTSDRADAQPVGLAADHLLLAATTLSSIVAQGPIALSFCDPTDPVILWGQGEDGSVLEVFLSPSHLP